MPEQLIAVLDLESTGLYPEIRDVLLEVGIALVTPELEVVNEKSVIIGADLSEIEWLLNYHADDWARRTHTKNGLLAQVNATGLTLLDAERLLLTWLAGHGFTEPKSLGAMAGSSVHFDQRFLRREMPTLLALFGHRIFDVSSTREQARLWRPDLTAGEPTPRALHRALPDVHDTLALARYYREYLFRSPS